MRYSFERTTRWVASTLAISLAVGSIIVAMPVIHSGSLQTSYEAYELSTFPSPYRSERYARMPSKWLLTERVAHDVAGFTTREADVVTDTVNTFAVLATTEYPRSFVITSDRDFLQITASPAEFGVHYVLVGSPSASGYDAIEAAHPGFWATGVGMGHVVKEWGPAADPLFRLFALENVRAGAQPSRPR